MFLLIAGTGLDIVVSARRRFPIQNHRGFSKSIILASKKAGEKYQFLLGLAVVLAETNIFRCTLLGANFKDPHQSRRGD